MSSYQMPYSQGLVPAIQQAQPMAQPAPFTAQMPNAGQDAYLASLQQHIKDQQKSMMDSANATAQMYSKITSGGAKSDNSDGFMNLIKAAAPLALALL